MGNCKKLNPYSCRECVPEFGKSENPVYAHPVKDNFQSFFKPLERRKPKLSQTSGRYRCSRNVSEVITIKILKDCKYIMNKRIFSGPEEEK